MDGAMIRVSQSVKLGLDAIMRPGCGQVHKTSDGDWVRCKTSRSEVVLWIAYAIQRLPQTGLLLLGRVASLGLCLSSNLHRSQHMTLVCRGMGDSPSSIGFYALS